LPADDLYVGSSQLAVASIDRPLEVDVLVGALAQAHRQAVALRARLRVLEAATGAATVDVRLAHLDAREEELQAREAELAERGRRLDLSAEKVRRRYEKLTRRKQELAAQGETRAEPGIAGVSRDFNLHVLEQRVAERRRDFPDLAVEWDSYLVSLRTVADTLGNLPASVDSLVDEVFAPLF
jgi:hypothetical protein